MAKSPISILQEYAARKYIPLPVYSDMGKMNDGTKFACLCKFNQIHQTIGYGLTKKAAKHESAEKMLDILSIDKATDNRNHSIPLTVINTKMPTIQKNFVGELNELASKYRLPPPEYNTDYKLLGFIGNFVTECEFNNYRSQGSGINKKDSKQDAAKNMLQIVKDKCNEFELIKPQKQLQIDDGEFVKITELYKNLTVSETIARKPQIHNIAPLPQIQISESIYDLKMELKNYNISYKLNVLQEKPCVMVFQVDNTDFTMLGSGATENDAIKDVLQLALSALRQGISVYTNNF